MQTNRRYKYSLLIIICLIASCFCFENIKTDGMVLLSSATKESDQVITEGTYVSDIVLCTVETVGSTHNRLFTKQTERRNSEIHRKYESMLGGIDSSVSLQSLFIFFTSIIAIFCLNSPDVAETILYIHNKDGKKRN